MEFISAIVLGLAGSLHCAGMCGPLALALPATQPKGSSFLRAGALYNLGRILTYCLLGLIFGLIGKSLVLAGVQRWVSISLGLILIVGVIASRRLTIWQPITRLVERLKAGMSFLLKRRSPDGLIALGMLNGLLPCGLVYVACAGAVATGAMRSGLVYMALFGLGTAPMLLAIGLSGKLMPFSLRLKLQRAIPVSVFLLGSILILRGMSLGIPYLSPDLSDAACCHR